MGYCSQSLLYALILIPGSIVFGAIIAFGSATLRIIKDDISTFYYGAFQAAPAFIAIFSPILWNFLLKRFKIKICAAILGFSGCVFWLLLLTMNMNYFWLAVIFRGLLGITLAGSSAIGPLFFSEIAPADHKGFYCMIHCFFVIVGHIITNLLGVTHKWQSPIYFEASTLLILGCCVFLIPDHQQNIKITNNENLNEDDQNDLKDLDSKSESELIPSMSLFDKSIIKTTAVAMTLLFMMQLCGIGSIMQNLAPLMNEVGLEIDAGYQAAIATLSQLFSSLLSTFLIDRLGCRILWILSAAGSTISLLLYGLNVKFKWSNWLPMIFLFCFQFFFGGGLGCVPWIYPSQVFPKDLVPKALSLGTSLTWLSATIVMFLFPFLQKWFGQFGLMIILASINFINFLIGIFFVKDNKKKKNNDQVAESNPEFKEALMNGDSNANIV